MGGSAVVVGWGLGLAVLLLLLIAAGSAVIAQLGVGSQVVVAAARAVAQLALVSSVIVVVARSLWLSVLFVLVMFAVASWTSARRVSRGGGAAASWLPIAAGTIPVLAIVVACGAVPLTGIAIVPIAGIVIGGAMTATSLAGRRALDELATRHGEYEAGLSLGFLPRDAAMEVCRPAATQALVPPLDQTRTVGLVTLPGAFVGVLLGSGDPVQAGAAQLLVLIGLLAAEVVAVLITIELVARGRIRRPPGPVDGRSRGPGRQLWRFWGRARGADRPTAAG
ncbi:MAG TPA: ABC transporter permease [Pseudonocardia sp.]|jgi:putative ABC transport system permease protein|uniref:ABC transporter permease n=1 Tax=Pseudonocardia sp. TaxID=60912 RepID=UPI002C4CE812|nr:ABC transporter permease [Pseudonocardia sp.]HTF46743.1 ABC transporter permease [Pseudonocardia sp.]